MKKVFLLPLLLLLIMGLFSCESKLDLSVFPLSNTGQPTVSETTYVQISPVWYGFNKPKAIIVGNEPVIYVADTKNDRLVQMDIAGGIIGVFSIPNPAALAQDYNFDLLVIADSVAGNDTLSILYRIKTAEVGGIISNASKIRLITCEYPTPLVSRKRKFTGVSVFPDNSYIVSRVGPDNTSLIDPDNALLKIKGRETVTSVNVLGGFQATGNSFYSIDKNSAVRTTVNSSTDFIVGRNPADTTTLNKVIWFVYDVVNGTYDPKFTSNFDDIVSTKFGMPASIAQDISYNIYVIDSYRNYLFKFGSDGKLRKESFGTFGENDFLNSPKGVSHYNRVLYIADTGNDRILRFKLSTDLN